jgi:hypothetical protein
VGIVTQHGPRTGWNDPGSYAHPQQSTGGGQPVQGDPNSAYGQYGLHHYHGKVQELNQVNQTINKQDQSQYGPLFGPVLNLINGKNEVNDKLTAAAKDLKAGLEIRSAPASAGAHYQGISHQDLYKSVTQGVDPAGVTGISDTWLRIGNGLANLQSTVAQSIASSQVTWTGNAAEQARQSIATLGNQSGHAGQSAQLAGVLTAQQSEALSTAKNTVPEPPRTPFSAAAAQQQLQTISDPVAFAKQAASDHATAVAQQASHKLAAHVVQQYDQTVSQTSASMPAFAPAPPVARPGQHVPVSTPERTGPGGGPAGGGPTGPGSITNGNSTHGSHTSVGHTTGSVTPTFPTVDPDQHTSTAGFVPPESTTGGPTFGSVGPLGTGVGTGGGPGSTGGLPGEFGLGGFGAGGGGGFAAGGSGGLGGSGAGGRFGAGGSGGSDASGAGAGRAGVGGAGAAAAEEAGTGGSAGSRGMGGMGAGRGAKGQGDAEHKRPDWLLENDEGIFGTDELTAPPVIGE